MHRYLRVALLEEELQRIAEGLDPVTLGRGQAAP